MDEEVEEANEDEAVGVGEVFDRRRPIGGLGVSFKGDGES